MNKVELLNYIHWFSLKTQFKNTSGSVQLRLHNKPLPGWGGGRIRSSLRTVISHTRLLVAPNAAPHLLASSRLWYQKAQKRWIKVMWVTFAGRAFHFITNIEVWILFNQPSWNIHNQCQFFNCLRIALPWCKAPKKGCQDRGEGCKFLRYPILRMAIIGRNSQTV